MDELNELMLTQAIKEILYAHRKNGGDLFYCVEQIKDDFKRAGYVRLAEDQTVWQINSTRAYKKGQEDLIKAGWRRVEEL
jgi:hypothetical protein